MLEDVEFKQEKEMFCVSWTWGSEMEGIEIRFKKSSLPDGEGAAFSKGSVFRNPGNRTGSVKRRITSEWGLYDFIFTACLRDGSRENVGQYLGVMIGEKRTVCWKTERRQGSVRLLFTGNGCAVSAGVVCMSYTVQGRTFRYILGREIKDGTRLEFPDAALLDQFEVSAQKPYDRAYSFKRL